MKPSNVVRQQQQGFNPVVASSANGPWRTNALGREYKISKLQEPGRKYYKQSNGSANWNVPQVSLKPQEIPISYTNFNAGPNAAERPGSPSVRRRRESRRRKGSRRRSSRKNTRTNRK